MALLPATPSTGLVLRGLGAICAAYLVKGVFMLYQWRTRFRALVKEYDLKTLPNHSFLFGDLITLGKVLAKYPSDLAHHGQFLAVLKEYPEVAAANGVMYIDFWPISNPMLIVYHPDMAAQFTQEPSMPKAELVTRQMAPVFHNKDLLSSSGAFWKKWRGVYNPGFAAKNIHMLVPSFIEEVQIWRQYMEGVARSGETIHLEDQLMHAACDIISRAVIGKSLHCQTAGSPLIQALKRNVGWIYANWAPEYFDRMFHPLRHVSLWNNNRIMRNELEPIIEEQLRQYDLENNGKNASAAASDGPKTINALATRAYRENMVSAAAETPADRAEFVDTLVEQLKLFLFAGHDTTSSTLCYIYYRLHQNPAALARLRAEHDAVFGPDPAAAAALIAANPILLNRLPYTTGTIKESMRISTLVASVRDPAKGMHLIHPETHARYPTEGFTLYSASHIMHRHAAWWPRPDEFLPERWLTDADPALRPRKNAFRPFELGARACIGQEMVMTEMRLFLAMTARDIEITPVYAKGAPVFEGDVAYQANVSGEFVPHPKGGMPVTVRMRKHVAGA